METDSHDLRLGRLIEKAMDRHRTDRRLDVESLLSDDPQYADQLAELLPVLEVLADLSSADGRAGNRRGNSVPGKDADTYLPAPIGTIGDYRIIRELGRGGMGVVFEAEQVSIGRRVALKVLPFAALLNEKQLERFNTEATAAARLQHGNIVPVYSVGCERGIHYYSMQLIDGPSLAEVIAELRQEGHPDAALQTSAVDTIAARQATIITRDADGEHYRAAARIAKQVAEALQYAHDNGVLHRDIKPTNLLLDKSGHVWIADFGLARVEDASQLTRTGDLLGTVRYMSPEQAAGETGVVDAQSDVYSLGATLYELTTLKPVFDSEDRRELIRQVVAGNPVAPHKVDGRIPKPLSHVIARAMARQRDERYKSASEFADDLRRFLNGEGIRVTPHSVLQPFNAWQRQHRWRICAAAVLGVAIFALCSPFLASHRGGNEIRSTPQTQLFPDRHSPRSAPAETRQRSSSRNRRTLAVETLEDRQLLTTLSIGDASATEGDSHLVAIDRFVSDTTVTSPSGLGVLVFGPDANNDGLEDLYAGSSRTHEVLRLDGISGTLIDVFVTARSGGLHNSADLKFGPDGHLYVTSGGTVANPEDNAILRYDGLDGHFIDVFAADLQGAISFDFGDDGDLYVANRDTNQILRFEGETGVPLGVFVDVAAGATGHLRQSLFGDDATGDGVRDLYVLSDTTRQVLRYDGSDGAFLGVFAQLSDYGDLMWADFGPDGSMYITARTVPGTVNASIIRLEAQSGAVVDSVAAWRDAWHIMVHDHGVVFSSGGTTSAFIDRFGPASLAAFTVQLSEAIESPITVNFRTSSGTATEHSHFIAASSTLRFASGESSKKIVVPTLCDAIEEGPKTFFVNLSDAVGGDIADNQAVATILPPTKFYVVDDAGTDKTFEYTGGGGAIENYVLTTGNSVPRGAASTAAGDKVWVVDANKNVFVYDTSGGLLGSWSLGSLDPTANVQGISTDGMDIWVVDANSDRVFRYASAASRINGSQDAASSFSLNTTNGNKNSADLVTDGTSIWVLDNSTLDRVFKYTIAGALVSSWTITTSGATSPTGIAMDSANVSSLWIVDSGTNCVYRYSNAASLSNGSSKAADAYFNLAVGNSNPQGIAGRPASSTPAAPWAVGADTETAATSLYGPLTVTNASARDGGRHVCRDKSGFRQPVVSGYPTAHSHAVGKEKIRAAESHRYNIADHTLCNRDQLCGHWDADPLGLLNLPDLRLWSLSRTIRNTVGIGEKGQVAR